MGTTTPEKTIAGSAVVIGGSVTGAAVASALSPHYENVLVVDRDDLPVDKNERKGAPHGHQYHALAVAGRLAFEKLYPGFTQEAIDDGVPYTDPSNTLQYCSKYGFLRNQPSDMRILQATRQHLEYMLRNRMRALPNVEVVDKKRVGGLIHSDGAVTGVELIDISTKEADTVPAVLVVDASGRASVTPDWLESLGYPRPKESTVNAFWGYSTCYVRPGPNWNPGYEALYIGPTVRGEGTRATRGAATWRQEDGLWVLTAQGCAGDYPPATEPEFRAFLGSFGRTEFAELFDGAEIVRPIVAWRNTVNRHRDYAALASRPENLLVIGDAVAAFNPVYGQGMSSAALSACLLGEEIGAWRTNHDDLTGFADHFQAKLDVEVLRGCWNFSTGSDLSVPGVEVDGSPIAPQQDTSAADYSDRVLALGTEDPDVALKLLEMIGMIRNLDWMAEPELQKRIQDDWERLGNLTRVDEPAAAR